MRHRSFILVATLLRGTARDLGCAGLRTVTVAIARRQRARRHGRRRAPARCRWLKKNGRLGRPASCHRPRFVRVRGAAAWRLKLRRRLPRGTYVARGRALDRAGNREWKLRKRGRSGRNVVTFRVR